MASLFALDFVSLLLSKDAPVQAGLSMSPFLKEAVPVGTLAATRTQGRVVPDKRKQDDLQVARGWKVQSLDSTVNSILESATRLEKDIESETKYWEQVLAVSEKGWAVCKLPQEPNTLGVRFGFSEGWSRSHDTLNSLLTAIATAAPAFQSRSLAALRRKPDGGIVLDQGLADSAAKAVRVQIYTDGALTGSALIPKLVSEDAAVERLILQARDTIYEAELYQELGREARTLTSLGVITVGDIICCQLTSAKKLNLELVPLEDDLGTAEKKPDDDVAEGVGLALRLLLSYAHRQNLRQRSQPPPPISKQRRITPPYALLRPLITRTHHQETVTSLNSLLQSLNGTFENAGIRNVAFSMKTKHNPPPNNSTPPKSTSELVIESLTDQLEGEATLQITSEQMFQIQFRTRMYPIAGTDFRVTTTTGVKPPPNFTALAEVERYLLYAASCAVASTVATSVVSGNNEKAVEGGWWCPTSRGTILQKAFQESDKSKQLAFEVKRGTLHVSWDWLDDYGNVEKGKGNTGYQAWTAENTNMEGHIKSLMEFAHEAARSNF